jgi:hypothetical protein
VVEAVRYLKLLQLERKLDLVKDYLKEFFVVLTEKNEKYTLQMPFELSLEIHDLLIMIILE